MAKGPSPAPSPSPAAPATTDPAAKEASDRAAATARAVARKRKGRQSTIMTRPTVGGEGETVGAASGNAQTASLFGVGAGG